MAGKQFDIDKHALDRELRDRIRAVIMEVRYNLTVHLYQRSLDDTLAHLQPTTVGTNIGRLTIGIDFHWDHRTHSTKANKMSCVLVILRQLIINYWDYLLGGSDESLTPDHCIEDHLETLEGYVEKGLDKFVVVGDVREGYWLMDKADYQETMEEVR